MPDSPRLNLWAWAERSIQPPLIQRLRALPEDLHEPLLRSCLEHHQRRVFGAHRAAHPHLPPPWAVRRAAWQPARGHEHCTRAWDCCGRADLGRSLRPALAFHERLEAIERRRAIVTFTTRPPAGEPTTPVALLEATAALLSWYVLGHYQSEKRWVGLWNAMLVPSMRSASPDPTHVHVLADASVSLAGLRTIAEHPVPGLGLRVTGIRRAPVVAAEYGRWLGYFMEQADGHVTRHESFASSPERIRLWQRSSRLRNRESRASREALRHAVEVAEQAEAERLFGRRANRVTGSSRQDPAASEPARQAGRDPPEPRSAPSPV